MPVDKLDGTRRKMLFATKLRQSKTGVQAFTKVFAHVNKSALRSAILQQLQSELARQTEAAALARDEAISEESRAENKWDTHSQEAAYLAEGQAKLAADIRASLDLYTSMPLPEFKAGDPIATGAVVVLEASGGKRTHYFLGPRAGGLELNVDHTPITVITPASFFGRQIIGGQVGLIVTGPGRSPTTLRVAEVL
jgi:hypothetical protein